MRRVLNTAHGHELSDRHIGQSSIQTSSPSIFTRQSGFNTALQFSPPWFVFTQAHVKSNAQFHSRLQCNTKQGCTWPKMIPCPSLPQGGWGKKLLEAADHISPKLSPASRPTQSNGVRETKSRMKLSAPQGLNILLYIPITGERGGVSGTELNQVTNSTMGRNFK